jgi:hypothetical protein
MVFYKSYNVSFVDWFLLAKAKDEKVELFTFDQKLQNFSNSSIRRYISFFVTGDLIVPLELVGMMSVELGLE